MGALREKEDVFFPGRWVNKMSSCFRKKSRDNFFNK